MAKLKLKLTWKLWILIILLFLSILAIFGFPPTFLEKGVLVESIEQNSTLFDLGMRQGDILKSINNHQIENLADYTNIITELNFDKTKLIINTNKQEYIDLFDNPPKITVSNIPKTKIKTGLDIQGGARALVSPDEKLTSNQMQDLISVIENRFNVYGLKEVNIKPVTDLSGNKYILIEIAGTTPTDLKDLISEQGKFEARIGKEVVFIGGEKDITYVCQRDATCSRIEFCNPSQEGGYFCRFSFEIALSDSASETHAKLTKNLKANVTSGTQVYLEKPLDLYLDETLVDSLLISENLKGRAETKISIQGSGTGPTEKEAIKDTQKQMNKLQTILKTGSLPHKLEIVKLDTISPVLGAQFIYFIFLAGLSAVFVVSIIIFVRYKKIKSSLAVLLTSLSEVIIILGIAAIIKWNLDLPSIAGILAVIGTGVDQQIVILDESRLNKLLSLKQRIKRAIFILIGSYFTTFAALIPLFYAGAGILKGFAFTTMIGITVGVLITRPAFADIVRKIEKD